MNNALTIQISIKVTEGWPQNDTTGILVTLPTPRGSYRGPWPSQFNLRNCVNPPPPSYSPFKFLDRFPLVTRRVFFFNISFSPDLVLVLTVRRCLVVWSAGTETRCRIRRRPARARRTSGRPSARPRRRSTIRYSRRSPLKGEYCFVFFFEVLPTGGQTKRFVS